MRGLHLLANIIVLSLLAINVLYAAAIDFQPVNSIEAGVSPRGVAVGNAFGNGTNDLVVADFGSPTFIGQTTSAAVLNAQNSKLQVFSPSAGGLKLSATIPTGGSPRGVCLYGLGNGGGQDILVTAYDANLAQVFSWRNGQFVKTAEEPTQKMPVGIAAGLTGSRGTPFVVVANYGSNTLSLFQVNQGKLGKRFDISVSEGPTQVAIGDLNGDGQNEIAVVCLPARQIVILSKGSGKPDDISAYAVSKTILLPEGSAPADLRISDLNGDGKEDLALIDFLKNALLIYLQQKDGSLMEQPWLTTSGNHPNGLTVADLNGDGAKEIIVANRDSDSIDIFQMDQGQFKLSQTLRTAEEPNSSFGPIEVGVLDAFGNGKKSLAASHMRSNSIKVFTPVGPSAAAVKGLTGIQGQSGQPFSEKTTFCYPNPTSDGKVKFSFTLVSPEAVSLQIYNVRGEVVWRQNLSPSQTQSGVNSLGWDGENPSGQKLASGLYIYTLTVGDKSVTKKVAIIH